jgi:hypothetical protein
MIRRPIQKTTLILTMISCVLAGGGNSTPGVVLNSAKLFGQSSPPCTTVPDLLAWWPGGGNANDVIGGNQGTLQNAAIFAPGLVGQAFSLNNPGSALPSPCPSCDYVSITNNFPASVNEVTVEAWIYPTQVNIQYAQWIYTQYPSGPQLGFDGTGEDIFWRPNVDGGAFHVPGSLPLNTWTHIAGTYSAITGLAQLYVNGNLVGGIGAGRLAFEGPPYSGPISLTDTPFIGKRLQQEFFGGLVDELSIYGRALTQSEIQAIVNAGSSGKCNLSTNSPPVARCQNVTVAAGLNCTANATIDDGSFDPDAGDTITLRQSPPWPYSLGSTPVTLTVTDNRGASSQCTAMVTVVDNTPPTISGTSASPSVLWPPNHKMIDVTINYKATDDCGSVTCKLGVTSNQGTSSDWQIIDAHHVRLRAERTGGGSGRVYTIAITRTDSSNNSSSQTVTVIVPHDQR